MNELNKLYKDMLLSWNTQVKSDGRILLELNGEEYPITIDGMDLYLPTTDVLDEIAVGKVFFHPACEDITSKETEVFKVIRKVTSLRLLNAFRSIPPVIAGLGGKAKGSWNQRTLDLLEPFKNAKGPLLKELTELFGRLHVEVESNGLDNRFVHFKTSKASGKASRVSGNKVYYTTKPEFPFYNELVRRLARSEGKSDNQQVEINNHSVSRAGVKLAIHLFQHIVPAVLSPDDHEHEANSPVAARLCSYLACYADVAEQINKVQSTFRAEFAKAGIYPVNLNWTELLENLPDWYKQVPKMDYNSHNTHDETVHQAAGRQDFAGLMSLSSNVHQTPQTAVPGGQTTHGGSGIDAATGFVITPPPQVLGSDRLTRYECNYQQGRVIHYGTDTLTNLPVMYICTKLGSFLERQTPNPNAGMMGMMGGMNNGMMNNGMNGMNMNGMGNMGNMQPTLLPNGMIMMPNGQMVHPAQLNNQQPVMPSGSQSVVNLDNNSGGGFSNSPAWG